MKNLIYLLSICSLLCCSVVPLSSQCMLVEIPIEDRINESVMIVEGKILSKRTFWDDSRGNIFTANRIEVSKVFKGDLQINEIELLTRGGIVGFDAQTDHPSLQVSNQEIGIFFLIENRELTFGNVTPETSIFQPSMGSQGFVKYNLKEGTASDPFKLYEDINIDLYQKIESITNQSFVKVSSFDISTATNPTSNVEFAANITSFLPGTVTAGTDMQLTITGTGFGASQLGGVVEFSNADDGGATISVQPIAMEYISWSDVQIVVEVPSDAGTGDFEVIPDGDIAGTSPSSLTVSWAQINVTSSATGTENTYQTQHVDDNGSGGYTWTYNTNFSSGSGVSPFVTALETLCAATNIYWMPQGTTTTEDDALNDGINIVSFDIGTTPLPGGVLGRMTSRFSGCFSGGSLDWYVSELDMLFNDGFTWNYGPGNPTGAEYDFESVALHELGHGHQLGHIIESTATVMHFSFSNGTTRRVLAATEEAGADDVYVRSTTTAVCGESLMSTGFSCSSLPIELLSFTGNQQNESILTNWKTASEENNDFFTLEHSLDGYEFEFLTEVDGKGNSTITNDYRFVHLDPTVGTNYYRLSQTDFDGTSKIEDIIAVDYKSDKVVATVVPNPIRQNEINLNYISLQNSDLEVEVIDLTGKMLIQTTVSVSEGENNIQLPAQNWASGVYYLRTIQNQTIKSIKFVKTN
jgi:hypothetical protein